MKTNGYRIPKDTFLPSPDYTPEEVMAIVLNALQHNDDPYQNAGIEVALNFSSPNFRPFPGPSEEFFAMIKGSQYGALINFERVKRDPVNYTGSGDRAEQRITVLDSNGDITVFLWILARQTKAPYTDCWMTDGVLHDT